MAEGCISVVEMTVVPRFVQQHAGHGVVSQDKNLPRLDVSKAGQWFVAVGAMRHRGGILCLSHSGSTMISEAIGNRNCLEVMGERKEM